MATFNISWSNAAYVTNDNVRGQRLEYKQRLASLYTLHPPDAFAKSITTAIVTNLVDNAIYQFKISALCNEGGPSATPPVEAIKFVCIQPTTVTKTENSITLTFTGLPADIHSVALNIGTGNVFAIASGGTATYTFSPLTPGTSYTIAIELRASVNNTLLLSALGNCSVLVPTNDASTCPSPTNLVVT